MMTVEPLMPLADAKKILGLSWHLTLNLIRDGELTAYNISGMPIARADIDEDTRGLRVLPGELRAYIQTLRVV